MTGPNMLAEGVAVLYTRLALARGDDPLPLELIAEVTGMEAPPGLSVDQVAGIAERMRRVRATAAPSWWDVVACPDEWVRLDSGGPIYEQMRRGGVPSVCISGVNWWRRAELSAWLARRDEP